MSRSPHERRLRILQTHVVDPYGKGVAGSREEEEERRVYLHDVKSVSRYVDWGLAYGVLRTQLLLR